MLLGCEQAFSPRGPFERKLAVFSVLGTDRGVLFVRVSSNYDVTGFDPYENTSEPVVTDARVSVYSEGTTTMLRDTVLPRPESSRYQTPIVCYVARPFAVGRGKTSELHADSPQLGRANASVTVPGKTYLNLQGLGYYWLEFPPSFDQSFEITGSFSKGAKGYVVRFFVVYDALRDSGWTTEEREVPTSYIVVDRASGLVMAPYPTVRRVDGPNFTSTFRTNAYKSVLLDISRRYPAEGLVFRQAKFRLVQLEEHLFNYYMAVNAFADKYSIRLDQPDCSNISSGYGVFGAYSVDSLVYELQKNFRYSQ